MCGDRGIGPQHVTKLQWPNPLLAAEDDQVEVMSASALGVPHQPASVWQGSVKLGGGLVAVRTQRLQQGIGLADRPHSSKDVDNRLGGESRNRGAADMFDGHEAIRQESQKAFPLLSELRRPSRVRGGKTNFFDDGLC